MKRIAAFTLLAVSALAFSSCAKKAEPTMTTTSTTGTYTSSK